MRLQIIRLISSLVLISVGVSLTSCHSARWTNQNTPEQDLAFEKLLQGEDPEAMFQMGYFHFSKPGLLRYSNGRSVAEEDQNYGGALKWFRKAAEAGHVGAMLQTANLCRQGMGVVKKNPVESVYWYQRAFDRVERDYSPFWLGDQYMRGLGGVTQDFQKALYYFNHSYGSYPLDKLLSRNEMTTEEIPKNTRFAIYGASALRRISLFYRCGWGVDIDVQKADHIIRQCARYLENPWCKRDLERIPPPCNLPNNNEKFDD